MSAPSLRRMLATTTSSGENSARPFASFMTRGSSLSTCALSRVMFELSSEFEPRCVTMALIGEPVALSAARNPFAIAIEDDQHRNDQRNPADREHRQLATNVETANVVGEWDRHYACLNMSVIRARYAPNAGTKPGGDAEAHGDAEGDRGHER